MEVKLGSASTTREAYLRFALGSFPGQVHQASLQLKPLATFAPGVHALALVTNDSWGELTVNWNTRPDSGLPPVATWTPAAGELVSLDVSSSAAAEAAGDGQLSLRVFATNATADGLVSYGAREGVISDAPALQVITTNAVTLSATQSFWVVVSQPNLPPQLPAQTNRTIYELTALTVTNTASDDFLPAGFLAYTLDQFPAGASISTNGVIDWTPAIGQGGSSNLLVTVASDGELTVTNQFAVTVLALPPPGLEVVSAPPNALTLQLSAHEGVPCLIQASTNLVDWTTVFSTNAPAGPFFWTDPAVGTLPQRYYRGMIGP
jgi:hypothetical protein